MGAPAPLSDEDIRTLFQQWQNDPYANWLAFARAVLSAAGVKGPDHG